MEKLEEKTEEKKEESKEEAVEETKQLVANAEAIAKRMEDANVKQAELIEQQKALDVERAKFAAEKALGGNAEAGKEAEPPKEETAAEYKDRVMAGNIDENS